MCGDYWLHVNHPNNKAIIHQRGGCTWVRRAVDRKHRGLPYGDVLGDRNGRWDSFPTREAAEAAQRVSGKAEQRLCSRCFGL